MAAVTWLGAARLVDGVPVRPVLTHEPSLRTAAAWRRLPYHPSILEVIAVEDAPLVAYADLHEPAAADAAPATWLAETLDGLAHVCRHASETGWLSRPILSIDLEHHARLGFLPARGGDVSEPEMGKVAAELVAATGADVSLIATLLDSLRRLDHRTLADASAAAARFAVRRGRAEPQRRAWRRFERACGYEECGEPVRAIEDYESVLAINPKFEPARIAASWLRSPTGNPLPEPKRKPMLDAAELEARGRFAEARELYRRGADLDARLGMARCHLALGQLEEAIEIARVIDAPAAAWIEAAARLRRGEHADALACASRLSDDDPAVWYLRGKALLALRKLSEARAALDRTCTLAPGHTAAQLLRVEVDRAASRLYRDLGRDPPTSMPTGPHADAVGLVLGGRVDDAIALLAGRDDRDARAMRASCLAFRRRFAEALAIYEALDGRAAALGRADCLLGLDRAEDALAAYASVLVADGYDVDALDGRARALRQLGHADADAAHARALAVALVRDGRRPA
jgi:tetratricopeptide (TPR) repeat protein